jgi:ATP-dependent DNA helicase UvrD/PcrA
LLIFAGAGSGKTRVLTYRIAHLIRTRDVRPHEILAVTFTNKAAKEMRARLEVLLGETVSGMWMGTFHSIGVRMLRRDGDAIGLGSGFSIYDETDRKSAMRRAMQALDIDEKRYAVNKVVYAISAAKNELLDPTRYEAQAHDFASATIARIYRQYERELAVADALDFDDLLTKPVQLLAEHEQVREYYQHRFSHIFVDEYQDTNHAQYKLISLLAAQHRNLTVVGDDDQSVYGWRGADVRNILDFKRDYPDANVVTLEQNYRSTQVILDAAHGVIRSNRDRAAKKLWSERSGGDPVKLVSLYDEQEEAAYIAAEIENLLGTEGRSLNDFAILYRTNAQSRAFEDVLLRRGIPYRLVGSVRFYERREVKDAIAYLRLVANPRDSSAFGRVVNVPRRKIGDKTISEVGKLARSLGVGPLDVCEGQEIAAAVNSGAVSALRQFSALIRKFAQLSSELPLPELVDQLMSASGYRAMLEDGTPEGTERWANVTELMGLAAEYADIPAPEGLRQFLENVALISDVDTLDDSATGVTLITLHAVKGLEFDVVFLAGMEEGLLPHIRALEEGDAGISEERRLAYVGITRARDRLYLLHAFRRHLYGTPKLAETSRFLSDVPAKVLEITRKPGGPRMIDPRARGSVREAVHTHASRDNPVEVAPQRFSQGNRVRHPRFGTGTILKSTMTRSGEEAVIKFDTAGIKIFAVSDATLELAGE